MKKSKTSYYGVERSEILDLLSPKYSSILDIGCGNGATMRLIKEKMPSAHILGIDIVKSSSAENTENIIIGDISNDTTRDILSKKRTF